MKKEEIMNVQLEKEEMVVLEGLIDLVEKKQEHHREFSEQFDEIFDNYLPYVNNGLLERVHSASSPYNLSSDKIHREFPLDLNSERISFLNLYSDANEAKWNFTYFEEKNVSPSLYELFILKAFRLSLENKSLKKVSFYLYESKPSKVYTSVISYMKKELVKYKNWTLLLEKKINSDREFLLTFVREDYEEPSYNILDEMNFVIEKEFGFLKGLESMNHEGTIRLTHPAKKLTLKFSEVGFRELYLRKIGVLPYQQYFWSADKETRLKEIKFVIEQAWGDVLFKKVHLDKLSKEFIQDMRFYVQAEKGMNLNFFSEYEAEMKKDYRDYFFGETGKVIDDYQLSIIAFIEALSFIDVENTSALFYYDGSVPSFKKPVYVLIRLELDSNYYMEKYEHRLVFDTKEEAIKEMKKRDQYLKDSLFKSFKEKETKKD